MIDFSGVSLPFGANDLLSSGVQILQFLGSFILLFLAVHFVPKIISLIVFSVKVGRIHGSAKAGVDEFIFHTRYKFSKKFRDGY